MLTVILSRGQAKEALEWTGRVLRWLEVTLNEKTTSIRNARQERSDFLGYTFGPHLSPRRGRRYLGYGQSPKRVSRIRQKGGGVAGSPERGTLGGSPPRAASQVTRLAAVLQRREHLQGISSRWMNMFTIGYGIS